MENTKSVWPWPQARQVRKWASNHSVKVQKEHIAQTGTIYLTLVGRRGQRVIVRLSDHPDAYGSADFTIDPREDEREQLKRWIQLHSTGHKVTNTSKVHELKKMIIPLLKRYIGKGYKTIVFEDSSGSYKRSLVEWIRSIRKQNNVDAITESIRMIGKISSLEKRDISE